MKAQHQSSPQRRNHARPGGLPANANRMECALVGVLGWAWFALLPAIAQTEPPHPILTISGSGSGASTILSSYTETQYTNSFIPQQSPRELGSTFAPAIVPGDTGWSWSAANPNQLNSTPSGTGFPKAPYTIKTQAVLVLSGKTVRVPYYNKAGSTTSKSLVFAVIDYKKRAQLRSDLEKLSAAYMNSGTTHVNRNQNYARRIAIALKAWADYFPDYYITAKNSPNFIDAGPSYILPSDLQRASDHNCLAHERHDVEILAFDAAYERTALTNLSL